MKIAEQNEVKTFLPIYEELSVDRPKTRGDCENGERPCVYASCRFNLFLDVKDHGKSITFNFPELDPTEMPSDRSCALDVAAWGGASLTDVAELTNLTRERIRQIQEIATRKIGRYTKVLAEFVESGVPSSPLETTVQTGSIFKRETVASIVEADPEAEAPEDKEEELNLLSGDTYKFLSDHPNADRVVAARVWRIYLYDSIKRGYEKTTRANRDPEVPEELSSRLDNSSEVCKKTKRKKNYR